MDRVERAEFLLDKGGVYSGGCSEFVRQVALIHQILNANEIMGSNPTAITNYSQLSPGDIVGWKGASHGHVAIYIGRTGQRFIDVNGAGGTPRSLNSYGSQQLYKSSRF